MLFRSTAAARATSRPLPRLEPSQKIVTRFIRLIPAFESNAANLAPNSESLRPMGSVSRMSFYGWADRTSGSAQIENHSETAWTGAQASSLALLLRPATETVALQSNQSFEITASSRNFRRLLRLPFDKRKIAASEFPSSWN